MLNVTDECYDDFHYMKKMFADYGIDVPFDPIRVAYSNPLFFDIPTTGELVGASVLVAKGMIEVPGDGAKEVPARVGTVIAHCHGRVIVQFPGIALYVGWIEESDYTVINATHQETSTVN